jgi:hypothetical protein
LHAANDRLLANRQRACTRRCRFKTLDFCNIKQLNIQAEFISVQSQSALPAQNRATGKLNTIAELKPKFSGRLPHYLA